MSTLPTARTSATNPGQHVEANRAGSWALVGAAQSGDADAFAQLYDRYGEQIGRFLGRRAGSDRGLVEDLTQETFLRAWQRINTAHDRGRDVGAWLTTIARNLLTDHHRRGHGRYERTFSDLPTEYYADGSEASTERRVLDHREARESAASAEQQVLDQLDRHTVAATVRRCLAELSPDQREALERYEQPVKKTADAMGRSERTVTALRHRAKQAMRQRLAAEGVTSSQRCSDAVASAQQAVRQLRRQPVDDARRAVAQLRPVTRPAPVDRWADESVACAVGAEVAL